MNYKLENKVNRKFLKKINFKKNKFQIFYFSKFFFFKENSNIFLYKSEINFQTQLKIRKYFKLYTMSFFSKKKIYDKDGYIRERFGNLLPKSKKRNFSNFLISIIKYNLPKIFLENFKDLENLYAKSKWPKNANHIITSYGQYYDELFKFYVANTVQNKIGKFYILQHGYGNIFIKNDYYNVFLDRKISNLYLSWGNLKRKKNKPLFYPRITNTGIKEFQYEKKKNIFIISFSFSKTLHTPPDGSINGNTINKNNLILLISFLNKIKLSLRKKFYIKNQNINISDNFTNSLKKKFPLLKFENEKKKFFRCC